MKTDFLQYQAQTSPHPLMVDVSHAKGSYIYDTDGKSYLDFVAGVSACTLGHCHPKVVKAVQEQTEKYMHVMVYGEYIQSPAVQLSKLLAEHMPAPLDCTYLVNSGTEAIEGSLKLAKRATGRSQLISAVNAYHGNTQGSMSVMGAEHRKQAFRPLLPDVDFIRFNNEEDLQKITHRTAGVLLETIQGSAGFLPPQNDYLAKVKKRCEEVGALLILDEIQPGFGRTGTLFGFEQYNVVPDIVAMGKGMGGGMPVGAFSASKKYMHLLSDGPKMGHITTFGGHPVIAAASLATLKEVLESDLMQQAVEKEALFKKLLQHPKITDVRGRGLMLAMMVESEDLANHIILKCMEKGLILFWLMFEPKAVRITPPLTISKEEIAIGCKLILESIEEWKA
ncbi:Acetylornithine/succinyldiaminopimelate/putrescine aminotransferase [Pustulibacterium marinum]|uniref:Acetylornithine/succinyldiaminopimelate/putrescine aminotransferase n=1 Tax=Pustulibacterium marinum TaxID=1224947 RepID=A0A1I7G5D5_9FLAO|nr:aspartate aminotransferase family protein [Pustulibacterium marinum]SFU43654.1 Acetylornithine/succinyldiaminopimelate/putrescine aminotransferase [Pustulibacterium marinum]